MERESVSCPLCAHTGLEPVYDGPIRSGGAESGFEDGYRVLRCGSCGIVFLHPVPETLHKYYEGDGYWIHHHGSVDIQALQRKHDVDQQRWFVEVGVENVRDRRVADFGCGPGFFLDQVRGVAAKTIGVDASGAFEGHILAKGHQFRRFGNGPESGWADVAVSFDTLEHVPDPREFLKIMLWSLASGGRLYIGVPNLRDYLKELIPDYLPFYYHKSHLYYFSAETLSALCRDAGFEVVDVRYVHKYDIMNLVVWARDRVGRGRPGSTLFDARTELDFRLDLERQGIASHLLIVAVRPAA